MTCVTSPNAYCAPLDSLLLRPSRSERGLMHCEPETITPWCHAFANRSFRGRRVFGRLSSGKGPRRLIPPPRPWNGFSTSKQEGDRRVDHDVKPFSLGAM